MFPQLALTNAGDSSRGYAVVFGQTTANRASRQRFTNGYHLLLRKTRHDVITTARQAFGMFAGAIAVPVRAALRVFIGKRILAFSLSALANLIIRVVFICAKKQVGRIDTRRIIASVADMQAVGNRAVSVFVHPAVGLSTRAFFDHEPSIAKAGMGGGPLPTGAEFGTLRRRRAVLVDLFHKAVNRGASSSNTTAFKAHLGRFGLQVSTSGTTSLIDYDFRLLEGGGFRLLEDGSRRMLEAA